MRSATVSLPSIRRGSMRCPLRNLLDSCVVCCAPRFSRSSAASFCCALGPAADAFPCRDDLKPPRSRPSPFPLVFFCISAFFYYLFELFAARLSKRSVGADYRLHRLGRIIGDEHEIEISLRDLSLAQHPRLKPAQQASPVITSEQNDRKSIDLSRLNQCECFEQLVERAEPAGENDECHRVLDEHRLPHE